MSRGDQRERDRQKALAKQAAKLKSEGRGGDPLKRNENDAAALQAKVAAKQAAKEAGGGAAAAATKSPVVPKRVMKNDAVVDDLLLVGLNAGKKKAVGAK